MAISWYHPQKHPKKDPKSPKRPFLAFFIFPHDEGALPVFQLLVKTTILAPKKSISPDVPEKPCLDNTNITKSSNRPSQHHFSRKKTQFSPK